MAIAMRRWQEEYADISNRMTEFREQRDAFTTLSQQWKETCVGNAVQLYRDTAHAIDTFAEMGAGQIAQLQKWQEETARFLIARVALPRLRQLIPEYDSLKRWSR